MDNTSKDRLYHWHFTLIDVSPGPSIGDAAEFIESLGLDPWSFDSLDLACDTCNGNEWISDFVVTGPFELVSRLHTLHDVTRNSSTAPPTPLERNTTAGTSPRGFN